MKSIPVEDLLKNNLPSEKEKKSMANKNGKVLNSLIKERDRNVAKLRKYIERITKKEN
jgi:hypothetical protein